MPPIHLILEPEHLPLFVHRGETIATVLARFNVFRAPDKQIRSVYTQNGAEIPCSTKLTAPLSVWVSRQSSKNLN
jgi:hypothetical protein